MLFFINNVPAEGEGTLDYHGRIHKVQLPCRTGTGRGGLVSEGLANVIQEFEALSIADGACVG